MAPNVWAHNIQICSHLSKYVNIYGTYLERLVLIPIYNDYCKINIKNLKKNPNIMEEQIIRSKKILSHHTHFLVVVTFCNVVVLLKRCYFLSKSSISEIEFQNIGILVLIPQNFVFLLKFFCELNLVLFFALKFENHTTLFMN